MISTGDEDRAEPPDPDRAARSRPDGDDLLRASAGLVLDANWTGRHTVPSRSLYPHQWSWDTAFIAVGLAHVAPDRAWRDLRSLFDAQWADGRVPHIVFDPAVTERDYFPGPSFWRLRPLPPAGAAAAAGAGSAAGPGPRDDRGAAAMAGRTTGILQPPVHALAAWAVYERSPGPAALDELRWLYPRLVAQQAYLAGSRDIGGDGLSVIVHPWESGLDNSPAWDEALAAVPQATDLLRHYGRRDTQVVAVEHRPTDADYARYLELAATYRDGGYDDRGLADRHAFLVECPGFNALRAAAELALARIAEAVGADPAGHRRRAGEITGALAARLFDPGTGLFHVRDVRTGRLSPTYCVNGLLPLILPDLPADQVDSLVAMIRSARFGLTERAAVPSYDRTAGDFDPLRYWRGPIWANVNWLLWRGLREHRRDALATDLRTALLGLARDAGFFEYFHADTGQGIGSAAFSWTAALTLDLLAEG